MIYSNSSITLVAGVFSASLALNALAADGIAVRVSIDNTPPVAQIVLTPRPNANGWNRTDVTARFLCSDAGSGIAQCPPAVTVSNEAASTEVSGTVVDKAGNRGTASTVVKLDRSAPEIFIDEPQQGALVRSSPVHLKGHVIETLSGLATVSCGNSAATVTGLTFSCDVLVGAGKNRIKIWASDHAGNVGVEHQHLVLGPQLPGGDAHQARISADVDGDGIPDVAYTNFLAGDVSILSSKGDGSFRAEQRVPVGTYPSSLAVADINGDGIADLITTHYTTGEVKIQYGQRDGSFVPGPHIAVGAFPSAVAVADIDGDGRLDVVTTHMHNARVHVHRSQVDGSYIEQPIQVGDGPAAVALGDVNGDGLVDVVTANFVSGDVSVLFGRPGRFQSEQRIALTAVSGAALGPTAVMVADVDGDGILDIATANFSANSLSLLLGTGRGRFQPPQTLAVGQQPIAVSAADFTGDGRLDLITVNFGSGDRSVMAAQGAGIFGPAQQVALTSAAVHVMVARPTTANVPVPGINSGLSAAANMPDPFSAPVRAPAPGLPAPADRMGLTFGQDTSDYGQLFSANTASYTPLVVAGRAGMKWVRIDANRPSFFGPNAWMSYASYSEFVDRLLAAGFNAHIIVTDFRWWPPSGVPYPADFPSDTYLNEYAQFAADLAHATHRPGRVIFEVWNEPDLFGMFWSAERKNLNEAALFAKMLTQVTEAIHTAVPGSIVVSGGLTSESGPYAAKFLPAYNQARTNRPLAAVNRFGFHPYLSYIDSLQQFRRQLDAAGLGAIPIDITEVGSWYNNREWVSEVNASTILRAVENDIPHVNFWAAISPKDAMALAGFIDAAPGDISGCQNSTYGDIPGVRDYRCQPSMNGARTFDRVARGRTYQGAFFDARTNSLPGTDAADQLAGLRALKFESDEDVVVAVYTLDWPRPIPGSGRSYSVAFPKEPAFVVSHAGKDLATPDANGRYNVTFNEGPLYFFFTKSGQPPTYTISARAVCADGSAPRSGTLKLWYTMWPTPTPLAPLDWQSPGVTAAGTFSIVSARLTAYNSNMYVAAEAVDGSGGFLPLRSSAHTAGLNAPTVTGATFFNPPTQMARLSAPSSSSASVELNFLALPEWCTQ